MTKERSIAAPADREAAINALAEEYAMRRIADEMLHSGTHPEHRREERQEGQEKTEEDRWQDVELTAYHIDGMTHNLKDRIRYDDEGNLLDDGLYQPLLDLVGTSLEGLLHSFTDAQDSKKNWPAYTVRNLLDRMLTALAVVKQEVLARRRQLGVQLADELGLALAEEGGDHTESGGSKETAPPWDEPSLPDKPIRDIHQFDAWSNYPPGDSFITPDKDGHVLTSGGCKEPRRTDSTVRVQILKGADKVEVEALLRKVIARIERDWASMTAPDSDDDNIPF